MADQKPNPVEGFLNFLARYSIAILVFAGFIIVSVVGFTQLPKLAGSDEEALAEFRYVFSLVFGALSAWGGTVIAFYFARENFAVATTASRELLQASGQARELHTTRADEIMVPFGTLKAQTVSSFEDAKVSDLKAFFDANPARRAILLTPAREFVAVVHRSAYDLVAGDGMDQDKSLTDFVDAVKEKDPRVADLITRVEYCRPDESLQVMKERMDRIEGCQDGFVTSSGTGSEPILGYIASDMIGRRAKVT